jgi:hypothetical protein
MAVTPLSTFGEHTWIYPATWASPNNRDRLLLDFLGSVRISEDSPSEQIVAVNLSPITDTLLIRQFKQVVWAALHRSDLLRIDKPQLIRKPTGVFALHQALRRLFVAAKWIGCRSLSDLKAGDLERILLILSPATQRISYMLYCFDLISICCRERLVEDGFSTSEKFEIELQREVRDTTASSRYQPLSEEQATEVLRISLVYMELAPQMYPMIESLLLNKKNELQVRQWAIDTLPCGPMLTAKTPLLKTLVALLHVSSANLIGYHLGTRISEMMSMQSGCVISQDGEIMIEPSKILLEYRSYKNSAKAEGMLRRIAVHPYIKYVSDVLDMVNQACGRNGGYLFSPPGQKHTYLTNQWNYYIGRFCALHGLPYSLTSHQWRETVAAIAVQVLSGAAIHIKELFGHSKMTVSARYLLASPFIREQLHSMMLDEYRRRGLTLLESVEAVGGPGIGGRQGKRWEQEMATLLSSDITEADLRKTMENFVESMLRQGIFPVPVMPGVFCVKPPGKRGPCSAAMADTLADPERCEADCTWQVQEAYKRKTVEWTVRKFASSLGTMSLLQQVYWAEQCAKQLKAWPELRTTLISDISSWPALEASLGDLGL